MNSPRHILTSGGSVCVFNFAKHGPPTNLKYSIDFDRSHTNDGMHMAVAKRTSFF
jgi:hypothetical protein